MVSKKEIKSDFYYINGEGDILIMKNYSGENWMKEISEQKLLSEINIPGTHDSGTKNVEKEKRVKYQCQNLSISEQMNIGVRYFDIRCRAKKDKGDVQYISHASIPCFNEYGKELTLDELIETGKKFLQKNPTETLIYQIKNEGGNSNDKRLCNYLGKYIKNNEIWSKTYIPHLKEVRGKIILVRRFTFKRNTFNLTEDKYGINLSSWDTECFWKMHVNTFVHVNDNAWVQDRYMVGISNKYGVMERAISEMNNSHRKPSKEWAICLSSCTNPSPIKTSCEINKRLLSTQSPLNTKKLGTFIVDFATEALIRKIYMTNF